MTRLACCAWVHARGPVLALRSLSGRHLGGRLRGFRLPELSFGEAHGQEWQHQRGITVEILTAVCRDSGSAGRPTGIRETVTCRRLRVLVSFGSVQLCSFFSLSDTVGYKEA